MVEQIFLSPDVKRSVKKWYVRVASWSRKSENFIELVPSAQSFSRHENFVSTIKNILKNKNWTFHVVCYFIWKLEFLSYVLWMNDCMSFSYLGCIISIHMVCFLWNHNSRAILYHALSFNILCYASEAWRGYLKCSIWGTNNQLPNIFYKFIHLQLFNIKHKIVYLQVVWRQIFVFTKSCLSQTEENGCLWKYERASLVSDFKLTRENDDLLTSRHK